jgi:hypothetical protein
MTPKEKAEELFNKYRPIIAGKQFVTGFVLMSEAKELTKRSALIAVDEIINEVYDDLEWWKEVKHEIEKL